VRVAERRPGYTYLRAARSSVARKLERVSGVGGGSEAVCAKVWRE
jgi:hypothetical protein